MKKAFLKKDFLVHIFGASRRTRTLDKRSEVVETYCWVFVFSVRFYRFISFIKVPKCAYLSAV